eukprot:2314889-Amphidinium_carterae.1
MKLREDAGLVCSAERPMMPVLLTDGTFGQTPMSSGEANRWVREIFMQHGIAKDMASTIGTHSLKATMLSWAAKFGLSREVRQ